MSVTLTRARYIKDGQYDPTPVRLPGSAWEAHTVPYDPQIHKDHLHCMSCSASLYYHSGSVFRGGSSSLRGASEHFSLKPGKRHSITCKMPNPEDDGDLIIQIICWREGYGTLKVEDDEPVFDIEVVIKNKNQEWNQWGMIGDTSSGEWNKWDFSNARDQEEWRIIEEDEGLFVSDELNERGWEAVITDWKIENELVIEEIEE